jgi:hypothetical protein
MDNNITLDQIAPNADDAIRRRLKFASTARAFLWCYYQLTKKDTIGFVYTTELAKFLGVTTTRAHQILEGFEQVELMWSKKTGGVFNEYHACKRTDGSLLMTDYVLMAKKTLGLI